MNKVKKYLLKNTLYIFLLANIIAAFFHGGSRFLWLNALAGILCMLMYVLIKLTIQRYAAVFGKSREEIADKLGRYIEDERRGKKSFYDYLMIQSMQGQSDR